MRELFQAGIKGLNFFSAIVFGIPLAFIAVALIRLPFQADDRPQHKVRGDGDCSIGQLADGQIVDYIPSEKDNSAQTSSCVLYFMPGNWELVFGSDFMEPRDGAECKVTRSAAIGHVSSIREPDRIGLNVPKIKVCTVVVALNQLLKLKAELGQR